MNKQNKNGKDKVKLEEMDNLRALDTKPNSLDDAREYIKESMPTISTMTSCLVAVFVIEPKQTP